MLPVLCRTYDRSLGWLISRFVGRPSAGFVEPESVPESPEDLSVVGPLDVTYELQKPELWRFEIPSPVESHWPESQTLRGRAIGPQGVRQALVVMHGACDNEYTYSRWMGGAFVKQGYRVLIPAAPCHLDRAPRKTFSGAPMFWSARTTVSGVAQWLLEIQGLIGHLRRDGAEVVGLIGYSVGSLTAGIAATLWKDLDFAALLAPVGHHLAALDHSRVARRIWPWLVDCNAEDVALLDRWAPVSRQPVIQHPLFLMTCFDDLQPYLLQEKWWQAWNRPARYEYRHGHMSILFCRRLYRDLETFARQMAGSDGQRSEQ